MMTKTGHIVLGSASTIALNATIQFLVADAPFKAARDKKIGGRDVMALGLELSVSGLSYLLFGPVPGVLGASEALSFFALRLLGVGAPKVVVNEPQIEPAPKLVPSTVVPPKPSATTTPAPAIREDFSQPEDFSGPDDFGNPDDFAGREDFANPENLAGMGGKLTSNQNSVKFIR